MTAYSTKLVRKDYRAASELSKTQLGKALTSPWTRFSVTFGVVHQFEQSESSHLLFRAWLTREGCWLGAVEIGHCGGGFQVASVYFC